jgi:type II protein arginine methyltransferase
MLPMFSSLLAVVKFIQHTKCQVAIVPRGPVARSTPKRYAEYIRYIANRMEYNLNSGFEDELRQPLQPLHENLDSSTYETFECDPAKYVLYQTAIERALTDISEEKVAVILIVGAGRGPLIRAAINAGKNTGRKLRILVVEKNPNAIVTLSSLIDFMWPDEDIKLIKKDMREVKLSEKADILVSELLGSFGDNELSPECLDGAQKLLKPTGVSIPCDSVAYLRPVMSKQAFQSIREWKGKENANMYQNATHMNWLSYLLNAYYIDESKETWRFVHPNNDEPIDNNRCSNPLTFTSKIDCVLHGFAGYFTSKLYGDIQISIHPDSHTEGLKMA